MEQLIQFFLEHCRKEWAVLKSAPISFLLTLGLAVTIAMALASWAYGRQIDTQRTQIEWQEARFNDLKDKLQAASPAEVSNRVDKLLEDLGRAKEEIAKLKIFKPDRHLSNEQILSLTNELKAIEDKMQNVEIETGAVLEPEPQQYVNEFYEVFKKTNIKFQKPGFIYFTTTDENETHGITIGVKNKENPISEAVAFMDALKRAGFKPVLTNMNGGDVEDNFISFSVGYN